MVPVMLDLGVPVRGCRGFGLGHRGNLKPDLQKHKFGLPRGPNYISLQINPVEVYRNLAAVASLLPCIVLLVLVSFYDWCR